MLTTKISRFMLSSLYWIEYFNERLFFYLYDKNLYGYTAARSSIVSQSLLSISFIFVRSLTVGQICSSANSSPWVSPCNPPCQRTPSTGSTWCTTHHSSRCYPCSTRRNSLRPWRGERQGAKSRPKSGRRRADLRAAKLQGYASGKVIPIALLPRPRIYSCTVNRVFVFRQGTKNMYVP